MTSRSQTAPLLFVGPDQGFNPAAEAFKNFDQDQASNMMGSLHLDTDDEPRRGASRANSVRFDESALHGHFNQGSRSSTEFLPMRTGSGFGSHPMTERSSSHKSDGRQSSTHSARASSFGFEQRPLSATVAPFVPQGPPPGLFILGPVPSIIRCWLNTNFSNESLLYAAICTGSFKSVIDSALLSRLGFQDQVATNSDGKRIAKLAVYLPEATIQQSSSRSSSPAPQLPTLTTEFSVQDPDCPTDAIHIFLGCDVLRERNADIHFSLDRLTLFDDERNKVSVPLVRPENATVFRSLQTIVTTDVSSRSSDIYPLRQADSIPVSNGKVTESNTEISFGRKGPREETKTQSSTDAIPTPAPSSPSVIGEGRRFTSNGSNTESTPGVTKSNNDLKDSESLTNCNPPDTPGRPESSTVWGSWRRGSIQGAGADASSSSGPSSSGYQRAGRGRGMKVLKPARLNTSRAAPAQQQPVGFDAAPSRFGDAGKSGAQSVQIETSEAQAPATDRRSFSGEAKPTLQPLTSKPRSANPIGGASAFGWLNSNQPRPPQTTTD